MQGVALPPLPADLEYCVVARRNDSLGRRRRWLVFGGLAGISLTLAAAFAAAGAWPVVPYSLLEVAVLWGAFAYFERHAGDWERLTVAGDQVVVERETAGRRERREFSRYWLRVELEPAGVHHGPRLTLASAGASWTFGDALPARERVAVARELKRLASAR